MRRVELTSWILVLLAPAILYSRAAVHAQVPAGPELHVNTTTTGPQVFPAIASDGGGNFVVAWHSQGDGIGYGVFGQRFEASGARLGGEFVVNSQTVLHQQFARVAADRSGDFVAVWHHLAPDADDVHARRFAASGAPRGNDFRVNTLTSLSEHQPDVATDAAGNFVVVWAITQNGIGQGISGQRFDSAGTALGAEFRVNTSTTGRPRVPAVASDTVGNFVVAWEGYGQVPSAGYDVFVRRFDSSGAPRGDQLRVNTHVPGFQTAVAVASDAAGNFVVAWESNTQADDATGIFAQRFAASGASLGAEFRVNEYTPDSQLGPSIASDDIGNFIVAWSSYRQDGHDFGVFGRRFDAAGAPRGAEFRVNSYTTFGQHSPVVASDPVGNFVVTWQDRGQEGNLNLGVFAQRFGGLLPERLRADTSGNGVFEPGESVDVRPAWRNVNGAPLAFAAGAPSFTGPPASGVSYTLQDAAANYGTVADGTTGECSDCFQVAVTFSGTRPAVHWDASLHERITPDALGQTMRWALHLGQSFVDVPRTNAFYRFVETLVHVGVTGGCGGNNYCPASSTTREQMAVFVLVAKEGAGYAPPDCAVPVFDDVPASSSFCRWIEELARRGVVSGCGGGNFCPMDAVTREQMAIFVLRTLDSALNPPACTTPMFTDVPASSPFCRWIEELARRGVVTGCGGGSYCPTSPVTREQMGVFISVTFGLTLYGPS